MESMTTAEASPSQEVRLGRKKTKSREPLHKFIYFITSYKGYSAVLPDVTTLKLVVRSEFYPSANNDFFRGGGS
jgi:hypothetical protein